MFRSLIFVAFLGCAVATSAYARTLVHPTIKSIVEKVNAANTTWQAGLNERFAYISDMESVKGLMGSLKTPAELKLPKVWHDVKPSAVPENFDARDAWGTRCPTVYEVRDQSACGSCWAFGAVEAATDRICIQTNGLIQTHLSVTDLLSCCVLCGFGCSGGYPDSAWQYIMNTGLVTGGNYGDNAWCSAYPFPQCDHHVNGKYGPCPSADYNTPKCPKTCDAGAKYNVSFTQDKHKFASAYGVGSSISQIQTEIMTYGPVEASFTVYEDFLTYKSGVYQYTTGSALGGHAVKIIGWGVDNGVNYWTVANSWNEGWGDSGFFKIQRGTDECGIEDDIVAGRYQ